MPLAALLGLAPAFVAAASRPNIAIVVADDLGTFDLSCMGHPSIQTPRLDAMAADGVIFTQCVMRTYFN